MFNVYAFLPFFFISYLCVGYFHSADDESKSTQTLPITPAQQQLNATHFKVTINYSQKDINHQELFNLVMCTSFTRQQTKVIFVKLC